MVTQNQYLRRSKTRRSSRPGFTGSDWTLAAYLACGPPPNAPAHERQWRRVVGLRPMQPPKAFQKYDATGDGVLDIEELATTLKARGGPTGLLHNGPVRGQGVLVVWKGFYVAVRMRESGVLCWVGKFGEFRRKTEFCGRCSFIVLTLCLFCLKRTPCTAIHAERKDAFLSVRFYRQGSQPPKIWSTNTAIALRIKPAMIHNQMPAPSWPGC